MNDRERWRRSVKRYQRKAELLEQGLEGSKVFAGDIIGDEPSFQPGQEYLTRITAEASHLEDILLTRTTMSDSKRTRVEHQLGRLQAILQGE